MIAELEYEVTRSRWFHSKSVGYTSKPLWIDGIQVELMLFIHQNEVGLPGDTPLCSNFSLMLFLPNCRGHGVLHMFPFRYYFKFGSDLLKGSLWCASVLCGLV